MEVRIIIADAGWAAAHAHGIISSIPGYYAGQYRRIKKEQEAAQELAAGFLLRKYLGVCSDDQLSRTENGKPLLRSGEHFFNLSHSGDYVVLAIADMDIGVDIEMVRDVHWPTVRKIFSQEQREQLEQARESQRPQLFTRLWTEWEAVLKLQGTGFGAMPGQRSAAPCERPAGWTVRCLRYKDYMISCAAYEEFNESVEYD